MVALIRGIVSLLVMILAVLFALANREAVHLVWSPVNSPLNVPLFLVGLGGAAIGFVAGAALMWLRALSYRIDMRRQRKQIEALEKDLEEAGQRDIPPQPAASRIPDLNLKRIAGR